MIGSSIITKKCDICAWEEMSDNNVPCGCPVPGCTGVMMARPNLTAPMPSLTVMMKCDRCLFRMPSSDAAPFICPLKNCGGKMKPESTLSASSKTCEQCSARVPFLREGLCEYCFGKSQPNSPPVNSANATQEGGSHYKEMGVQPWDVIDTWPLDQRIGAYRAGALKYIMRMGSKDQHAQEIKKARHYCEKLVEVLTEALGDARKED